MRKGGVSRASATAPAGLTRRTFLTTLAAATLTPKSSPNHPPTPQPSPSSPSSTLSASSSAPKPPALTLELDNATLTLSRDQSLIIDANANRIIINSSTLKSLRILTPTNFIIEVPNKLRRHYVGTLHIANEDGHLRCVIGIERELAVASIVAAESPPYATPHALAAQAIAARSFLLGATTAHIGANFCDTTHCQFLREPPPAGSPFTAAAQRTAGLILQYRNDDHASTLAAMYSRSCGGRTRTPAELGLPSRGYPYYAVECASCRAHPERWQRDLDSLTVTSEHARLDYNRIHGWSALPATPTTQQLCA